MYLISVIMPVCNNEQYVHSAINSVLEQSFVDFELIILDFGSADNTLFIVKSFTDKRIRVVVNVHNYIGALNLGLELASGKYIAFMFGDDIMHVDRLKIQYAVMEAEVTIIVCGSGMKQISDKAMSDSIKKRPVGLIDVPLLTFLQGNYFLHSTVMLRRAFLIEHTLCYEDYPHAEDFKLWTEIAKCGGDFYVENQPLLFHRVSECQGDMEKNDELPNACEDVMNEVVESLIDMNKMAYPELETLFAEFNNVKNTGLLTKQDVILFFYSLFTKNRKNMIISYI